MLPDGSGHEKYSKINTPLCRNHDVKHHTSYYFECRLFRSRLCKNTSTFSPWDMADHVAAALRFTEDGYSISDEVMAKLNEQNAWALLINNDTRQVVWQTEHLPDNIPMQYTLSDIAELTRGYIDGCYEHEY